MKWKDRDGKEVSGKEFMQRWKSGIQNVTPLQQAQIALFGYAITLSGILWGIIFTFHLKTWWLFVILLGSFVVAGLQAFGGLQKYLALKNVERMTKEMEGGQ